MDFNDLIFNKAKETYGRTNNKIFELAKEFGKLAEGNGTKYNPQIACDLLDISVQFSLLQIAMKNEEITDNQFAYISNIVVNKDLTDYLASYTKEDMNWNVIKNLGIVNLRKFLNELEPQFFELARHLCNVVIYNDYNRQNQYYPLFQSDIETVLIDLEKMEERNISRKTVAETVLGKCISRIKEELKQ